MEREAPFILMIASCFLRFPNQTFWNGFGSQSFPKRPERSARFARCARLIVVSFLLIFHWFFNLLLLLEMVSISIDLNWIFMPTWLHVGLIFRLLVHLGAFRARLGATLHVLGRLGRVLRRLGQVLGCLGSVLGRLKPS